MDKDLIKIVQVIRREFPLKKVLLFGSRANGSPHSGSDYDLAFVITESSMTPLERAQKAHRDLWNSNVRVPTDIFIYTIEEFERGKELFNSIPEIASNMGVEVELDAF